VVVVDTMILMFWQPGLQGADEFNAPRSFLPRSPRANQSTWRFVMDCLDFVVVLAESLAETLLPVAPPLHPEK